MIKRSCRNKRNRGYHDIIISNTMIFWKAEGGLWNSRGRSPREFHKPPEGEGHLITNFQNIMVLVCNTMVNEDRPFEL